MSIPQPARIAAAYRATGADLPTGDPARAHGVALEGYYWRIVQRAAGAVVVALGAVCRDGDEPWGRATLAAHPGGFARTAFTASARADPDGFGMRAEDALRGDARTVTAELGPDAALDVELDHAVRWPRRGGALGLAHAVPGLPHYWHPVLLGARVSGRVRAGQLELDLDGAVAYAEKNWGRGFPGRWWWGHAAAFDDAGVAVAFAGGHVRLLGSDVAPTSVVVMLGDRLIVLTPPLARTDVRLAPGSWLLRSRGPRTTVEIAGSGAGTPAHQLLVPVPHARSADPRSHQHLAGRLELRVRSGRRLLFAGASELAGLELGDPVSDAARAARPG